MIAFGLFLLLAIGITAGFALASGDDPATLNLLGFDIETNDRGIFAAGAVCAIGVFISYRIIVIGWRRMIRRRRELRELRESVNQTSEEEPEGHSHRRSRSDDFDDESNDERDHFESAPHD
jgi:hypothetical protein